MKKLLKVLVLILFATFTIQTNAQTKFGIKAGLNAANISQNFKESDWELKTKLRLAYHIGATLDFELNDNIGLQSGLILTSKGLSIDAKEALEIDEGIDGYNRIILNYLEIPINLSHKIKSFQVYAGPYFAIGIGGKNKWDYNWKYDGIEESDKGEYKLKPVFGKVGVDDLGDDEDAFKALDFGFNFGIGYQTGPILINAGYSLGLGNITPAYEGDDDDPKDYKMSNRVFSLSVGYFFGE